MPELPEVETVRRGLMPVMVGKVIERVQVRRPDLRRPFPERMAERLTGARITRMWRRSKYILMDLSTEETLLVHLGMSGRMLVSQAGGDGFSRHPAVQKHDHVVFDIEGGARVTFNDARRFGTMDLIDSATVTGHPLIRSIGPEPLGNDFNEAYLSDRLKHRNSPIKNVLLDQKIVAGLGNIYVCEVLFRTGISPQRKASQLSRNRVGCLVPAIREVLAEAIESGGASLKDYRQADGELGYFQHSFRVYGREGKPCLTKDCNGFVARITQSGRSSFYCPQCQR